MARDGSVSTPLIPVQFGQVGHESRPDRIQMDVTHEFSEIGVLLADNGLVAILEQVAIPLVPPIEVDGMAGEQASHEAG